MEFFNDACLSAFCDELEKIAVSPEALRDLSRAGKLMGISSLIGGGLGALVGGARAKRGKRLKGALKGGLLGMAGSGILAGTAAGVPVFTNYLSRRAVDDTLKKLDNVVEVFSRGKGVAKAPIHTYYNV